MKYFNLMLCLALALLVANSAQAQTPQSLFREWQQQHVTNLDPSRVRHADLKGYLDRLRAEGISVREVGRSTANREIFQMEFGRGPLKVFMWSQMHGDEPTATSALVDLFHYLQRNRHAPWIAALEKRITLRAVPMLNPDGAELYQRRNLQSIDINRDARALATPEGRLLKKLRDEWQPDIGFNLHNENPRTAVGNSGLQSAISLLAVAFDPSGGDNAGRIRGKKICAVITEALDPFIKGHIARYDDTFNPRAFGDMFSRWGTPVVLVETGALKGKSETELVQLNFVAFASALEALSDGSVEKAQTTVYEALPFNTSGTLYDLIVRNATIISRFEIDGTRLAPFVADFAINEAASWSDGKFQRRASIQEVGDLSVFYGIDEVNAADFYVVPQRSALRNGAEASLLFYRKERASKIDWTMPDLETRFPPDAVYRNGEWTSKDKLTFKR